MRKLVSVAIRVLVICACAATVCAKRKDDVVVFKNGDRMTGEIKSLKQGELNFKADYMAEAVRLDWSRVASLESKDSYMIFLKDGQFFTDSFQLVAGVTTESDNFLIGERRILRVKQMNILRILPIEKKFWQQLEGSIDLGLNFTSGNDQYQTSLTAELTYRKGDNAITTLLDSAFSGQTKGSSSARNQFDVGYRKQLSPKWYAGGLFDLLRSDQQSLAMRVTAGGTVGRNLIQTERTRLSVFGGLALTRERYQIAPARQWASNADAIAGLDFTTFRFNAAEVRSAVFVYPSVSNPGRVRTQIRSDLNIKLAKDFWWGLHLYENFDSKPPIKADRNDLGITASIGWKF